LFFEERSLATYQKYSDKLLVNKARSGDLLAEQCIINKYKKMAKIKAKNYFMVGADSEDVIQEGMIGLYKAIRCFNNTKISSFKLFAEICVHRQIITAIKKTSRKKHKPLNYYISLNKPVYAEDSIRTFAEIINNVNIKDPTFIFVRQEKLQELKRKLKNILSKLERIVLELYLEGKTYKEIAREINGNLKSIDNAMQRIKRKTEIIVKLN